jgi:general secretion pathway protein G
MKNSSHSSLAFRRGFTLMELLVVVAIIVILASLVLGGLSVMQRNQAVSKCKAQIGMLSTALDEYKMDFGRYPVADDTGATSDSGANVLFKALYWDSDNDGSGVGSDTDQRSYLPELDPTSNKQGWRSTTTASANNTIFDPWGANYRYRSGVDAGGAVNTNCKNPDFDLWSLGPDGKLGNTDGTDKEAQDNISNWK